MMLVKEGGKKGRQKRFDETFQYLEKKFVDLNITEPAITFPIEFVELLMHAIVRLYCSSFLANINMVTSIHYDCC